MNICLFYIWQFMNIIIIIFFFFCYLTVYEHLSFILYLTVYEHFWILRALRLLVQLCHVLRETVDRFLWCVFQFCVLKISIYNWLFLEGVRRDYSKCFFYTCAFFPPSINNNEKLKPCLYIFNTAFGILTSLIGLSNPYMSISHLSLSIFIDTLRLTIIPSFINSFLTFLFICLFPSTCD